MFIILMKYEKYKQAKSKSDYIPSSSSQKLKPKAEKNWNIMGISNCWKNAECNSLDIAWKEFFFKKIWNYSV